MKKLVQRLWKDESGQGATEYILLLVVVVAVVLLFGGRIREALGSKLDQLSGQILDFNI